MDSLPTWAVWSIVMPLVLLSPVIAFLLALAAEAMVLAVHDVPVPLGVTLAAGGGVLFLFRRLRTRAAETLTKLTEEDQISWQRKRQRCPEKHSE